LGVDNDSRPSIFLGIVGLALFLGILLFAFKAALPVGQRSDLGTGVFLGLIVFVFAGMTLSWENEEAWVD
jgi:hypothetical protein